jgi:NADH-quinone oxidoreductase subunit N
MLGPDLAVILPEIVLSLFAMGALLGAVYTSKDGLAPALTWGTALLLAIMGAYIALTGSGTRVAFEGMFVDDAFARFAKVTILWSAAAVLLISQDYMTRNNLLRFEYPVLVAGGRGHDGHGLGGRPDRALHGAGAAVAVALRHRVACGATA